jgi:UDP-4-amino-4,6-dideoxy-N-acetyl-beta-L-altrosamine transaminase
VDDDGNGSFFVFSNEYGQLMPKRFIPYSRQHIDEDDIEAVARVLRSDWLTQGPDIEQFEQNVAAYCHAPHAVAAASATAGLHIACMALGLGRGDRVWTSPLSFVASANCARYLSADVDFVDIEPDTGNLSVPQLERKLQAAERSGRLPKILIPVHYAGRACDMKAIAALKARYGFTVIEDAAHALGAFYANDKPVGSNSASEAIVFSFHPVKSITTGEGGAVVTHDGALADRLRMLRRHGITRDPALLQHKQMPAWYYEQQHLGYHYRMTDLQAALGSSQLKKLERFMALRRTLAERYHRSLETLPLQLPAPDNRSSWHLYPVVLKDNAPLARDALFNAMRERGIGVNVHYFPIYLQPYYRALGFTDGHCPEAEAFASRCLSLPLHPGLSQEDQDYVIETLRTALSSAN